MNRHGLKAVPFQLAPLRKSDLAQIFKIAYWGLTEHVEKFLVKFGPQGPNIWHFEGSRS